MENKGKINKILFKKTALSCLAFIVFFGLARNVDASTINLGQYADQESIEGLMSEGFKIEVDDATGNLVAKRSVAGDIANWAKQFSVTKYYEELKTLGSDALKKAIHKALLEIAYDTATWIGSGGEGQKPMFIREGWGEYLTNVADNAAGNFIEIIGREWNINLCRPSTEVRARIGLGLVQMYNPGNNPPACTFRKMVDNWENEINQGDFLEKFQDMFEPTSNDLGIALSLQSGIMGEKKITEYTLTKEREEGHGWLNIKDLAGRATSIPLYGQGRADQLRDLYTKSFGEFTGDALIDAANVFLNQLAISSLNRLLASLGEGLPTYTSPYAGDYGLLDYQASPAQKGKTAVEGQTKKILEAKFDDKNYEILAELTMCPDPTKAGPTDCVITSNFMQAIAEKMTVREAYEAGYLLNGTFGFTADGLEPNYNQGYPYRSMIILRKFRIIPVGWELAAQYIKDNISQINGAKNLMEMMSCFDPADDLEGYYATWCEGLVDPDWVLKAPLNYCKREGPGPEITSESITGQGEESKLIISRDDGYCGDEQTCIKESGKGACEAYGYCTEERRKWNFNGTSCEPKYSTCQTFRNQGGKTVSYLENTLDYSSCNANNIGCKKYNTDEGVSYNPALDYVHWGESTASIYFNNSVNQCDSDEEGCHEYIRTKAGIGANLIANSSFENNLSQSNLSGALSGWGDFGSALDNGYSGAKSLKLNTDVNALIRIDAPSYSLANQIFTLSFYTKNCDAGAMFGVNEADEIMNFSDSWQFNKSTHLYPSDSTAETIKIVINKNEDDDNCLIDAIKLESGSQATVYSDYRANGLVREKLLPGYLEDQCYSDSNGDGFIEGKANAPTSCDNFVRECTASEVGCELYTAVASDIEVAAKANPWDYCDAECVGFNTYIQSRTAFESLQIKYFIPKTAKTCGSNAVGCDQFTNLDEVEKGGEAIDYYKFLRQCIKSDDPDANCGDFYTWEGSSENGFQLKVFNLQKAGDNEPYDLSGGDTYEGMKCNEFSDYDLANNPMCREFYNTNGKVFYKFLNYTMTCSGDCHPLRRTEKNIEASISGQAACGPICSQADGEKRCWDSSLSACYSCINGGYWSSQHGACIYNAIPDEGLKCSASQAGCREYKGSGSDNFINILSNNFEDGTNGGWQGGTNSTEALKVGEHSISNFTDSEVNAVISKDISGSLTKNEIYRLSFWAKPAEGGVSSDLLEVYLEHLNAGAIEKAFFEGGIIKLSDDWGYYSFSLALESNYFPAASEKIVISSLPDQTAGGSGKYYYDDIVLSEVTDRYFLIKNSWVTPNSCNEDILGNPHPLFDLGCEEYRDRDNNKHYLRQFSQLCQDSAVGCELMIDTFNSTDYESQTFNAGSQSQIIVPADQYIYLVYDADKQCSASDKGCQRLGVPYQYNNSLAYSDVYLNNNPDNYNTSLCTEDGVGCQQWEYTNENGSVAFRYFKDPGDMACEWRQQAGGTSTSWGWYKKKVKRCDSDANSQVNDSDNICLANNDCLITAINSCQSASDCGANNICQNNKCYNACLIDNNDYVCQTTNFKTFGYGGKGNVIYQPTIQGNNYWAGLCPAEQSGCTEYIDPVSESSANLIFNPEFKQNITVGGSPDLADGWQAIGGSQGRQSLSLEPNTLYVLAVEGNISATLAATAGGAAFYDLGADNSLGGASGNLSVASSLGGRYSRRFYTAAAVSASLTVSNAAYDISNARKIEVKKAIVDYQLKQDLTIPDTTSVNFSAGNVLFNERSVANSGGNKALDRDADNSPNASGNWVSNCSGSQCDANALIKVSPDRICDKWLACRSYSKDENDNNVCYDVGLCDSLDDNSECNNFLISSPLVNQAYSGSAEASFYANKSGYVKVGYAGSTFGTDFYPLGGMEQKGEIAEVPNGSFEFYLSDNYPVGWFPNTGSWDKNLFSVINNPIAAQTEGVDYPIEGKSFLKNSALSTKFLTSEYIDVEPNTTYIFSAYINTKNLKNKYNRETYTFLDLYPFDQEGNPVRSNTVGPNPHWGMEDCQQDSLQNDYCTVINGVQSGRDWRRYAGYFRTNYDTHKIKIINNAIFFNNNNIGANCVSEPSACIGSVYLDDIKIKPVLNNKLNSFIPQSCRLYPETDSLSCDYFDDAGMRNKGLLGYCLEYDRYPGTTDACLLWYPIDKVKGDGIEEGAGYTDRFPLYYCLQAKAKRVRLVENRKTSGERILFGYGDGGGECDGSYCDGYGCEACASNDIDGCPHGYIKQEEEECSGFFCQTSKNWEYCAPDTTDISPCGGSWYYYDGDLQRFGGNEGSYNENDYGVKLCDLDSGLLYDTAEFSNMIYCSELVETVTPAGQNKFWSGRAAEGSDYIVSNLNYNYNSGYRPFGSLVPPAPAQNPYEWDAVKNTANNVDKQPLPVKSFDQPDDYAREVNAGSPYSCVGNGCGEAGLCSSSRNFCYNLNIPSVPDPYREANFANGYICPGTESCQSPFPINDLGTAKELVKQLFAQSYGFWSWDVNQKAYVETTGQADRELWTPPSSLCDQATNTRGGTATCNPIVNTFTYNIANGAGCSTSSVLTETYYHDNCYILTWDDDNDQGSGQQAGSLPWVPPTISLVSLGVWEGRFQDFCHPTAGQTFTATVICEDTEACAAPYCAVRPEIHNIKVNNQASQVIVNKNGFVNLTFNSKVDGQQLPLVMYDVDWGDSEKTTVSGVEMRDHQNPEDPHSLYHLYSYWDLMAKKNEPGANIDCSTAGECRVKPKIKIKDNWGWCNGSSTIYDCNYWQDYPGIIIVKEN